MVFKTGSGGRKGVRRVKQRGLHGRSGVCAGPLVRFDRETDILGGVEDLNRGLGKGEHCVASWEPKPTHHGACAWHLHKGAVGDGAGKAGRMGQ